MSANASRSTYAPITRQHDSADDAATRKAGARPKRPPRSPFRSVEIRSRTGVRGLSIAAVLERAQLSTRAFYRHFDSKDQLVAAVFLEMARVEMRRLRTKMANTPTRLRR